MDPRRVVITGAGIVSSLGHSLEDFWSACIEGRSVVAKVPEHWRSYASSNSKIYSPLTLPPYGERGIHRIEEMQLDPVTLNGIFAAQEAISRAGIQTQINNEKANTVCLQGISQERSGVFMGTGVGGLNSLFGCHGNHLFVQQKEKLKALREQTPQEAHALIDEIEAEMRMAKRFNPYVVSMTMPNACAAMLSIKYSLHGAAVTTCAACASGTVALGNAFHAIRSGKMDFTLTGGTEYMSDETGALFRGFDIIRALASTTENIELANCPFDERRSGFLFSDGAASVFVFEELEHARNRNAPIIAEVIGFAETSDAFNIMSIDKSFRQIERMLKLAFEDAAILPTDIDYINTHGTGTQLNDEIETEVIDKLFPNRPAINSTKSLIGHTLGASGAIEALVAALSLQRQESHLSRNLRNPIKDLNFLYESGPCSMNYALSQSFAFGGHNAALILKRYESR